MGWGLQAHDYAVLWLACGLTWGMYANDLCRRRLGSEANESDGIAVELFGSPASDGNTHMSECVDCCHSTLSCTSLPAPSLVSHTNIIPSICSPHHECHHISWRCAPLHLWWVFHKHSTRHRQNCTRWASRL